MEKEGGNRERMRKCRESISLHFLIFPPFPHHFLILSPFPRSCLNAMITSHSVGEAWVYPRAFLGRGGQGVVRKVLGLNVFYKAFLSESLTKAMITLHLVGGVWDYQRCTFFPRTSGVNFRQSFCGKHTCVSDLFPGCRSWNINIFQLKIFWDELLNTLLYFRVVLSH